MEEKITCLRIEVAELRKDVFHLTESIDSMRNELQTIRSESDQRKPIDKLIIVGLTSGVSALVAWVMTIRGGG